MKNEIKTQEHTPGEWIAKGTSVWSKDRSRYILIPSPQVSIKMVAEAEANARLIAAAPSLLDVAEEALEALDHYVGDNETSDKLRKVIAAARGEGR